MPATGTAPDSRLLSTMPSFDMPAIKKKTVAFFKNHDVNISITFTLAMLSTYVALCSVLHKNIFKPLMGTADIDESHHDPTTTAMAVLILWSIACATGKVLNLCNLPFPFGAMLVGVVIGNVPLEFFKRLHINTEWDFMVRRIALEVLIIRWGLAFNFSFIGKNLKTVLLLGTIPALAEAGAITLVTAVVFGHHWGISVMLGAVMAAASVPVVIPVMFQLTRLGLGSQSNLPKIIPSCLAIDTFICLTIFTLAGTSVFAAESAFHNILQLLIDVGLCIVGSLLLALILWHFPKSKEGHTILARGYILLFSSVAAINGMFYFGHGYAGIIFVLILASISGHRWRNDNSRTIVSIEKTFLYIWNLVSSPLLFVLVGMKLKFNVITYTMALSIFVLVVVGIVFRIAAGYIVSNGFKQNERIVIIMSMLPKATLQGALAPAVLTMASVFPHLQEEAEFLVNAVLLNILFTAPIGRYLLANLAPKLLAESEGNPVQPPSIHSHDSSSAEEDITITDASYKSPAKKEDPTDVKVINCFDNLPSFHIREQ